MAPPTIEPLHAPGRAAVVQRQRNVSGPVNPNDVIPGQTVDPAVPGAAMGQKALLAKKMAQANSKPTVSPTDQHDSPTTRKLKNVKERHFAPGAKGKTPAMQRMAGLAGLGRADENAPPS